MIEENGNYSECFYYNDARERVDPDQATHGEIYVYKADGTVIERVYFNTNLAVKNRLEKNKTEKDGSTDE